MDRKCQIRREKRERYWIGKDLFSLIPLFSLLLNSWDLEYHLQISERDVSSYCYILSSFESIQPWFSSLSSSLLFFLLLFSYSFISIPCVEYLHLHLLFYSLSIFSFLLPFRLFSRSLPNIGWHSSRLLFFLLSTSEKIDAKWIINGSCSIEEKNFPLPPRVSLKRETILEIAQLTCFY